MVLLICSFLLLSVFDFSPLVFVFLCLTLALIFLSLVSLFAYVNVAQQVLPILSMYVVELLVFCPSSFVNVSTLWFLRSGRFFLGPVAQQGATGLNESSFFDVASHFLPLHRLTRYCL